MLIVYRIIKMKTPKVFTMTEFLMRKLGIAKLYSWFNR